MADPDDDSFLEELQQKHPRARRGSWIPFVTVMLVLAGIAVSQMQNRRARDAVRSYPPPSLPASSAVPPLATAPSTTEPVAPAPTSTLSGSSAIASFDHALEALDTIVPGSEPCPVTLRAPPVELAASERPTQLRSGEMLARALGGSGERFGKIVIDRGEPLPSRAETRARYQVIFAREQYEAPIVDERTRTFSPGRSQGRAYLVDTDVDRVICAADIDATSIAQIEARTGPDAAMWLTLQLGLTEDRAIATSMRAVLAPPPSAE